VKQIANDHGVVLGIIGTGPVSSWSTWIPSTGSNSDQLPAGFDWYGQDTYQTYHVSTADGAPSLSAWTSYLMNPLLNLAKSQTGWAHPRIYIPETGSNFGCQGGGSGAGFGSYYAGQWHYCTRNRPQWHNMVAHWLHANCTGSRMCIFWSDGRDPTQSLNGPWTLTRCRKRRTRGLTSPAVDNHASEEEARYAPGELHLREIAARSLPDGNAMSCRLSVAPSPSVARPEVLDALEPLVLADGRSLATRCGDFGRDDTGVQALADPPWRIRE
jgi:hypothetical protein